MKLFKTFSIVVLVAGLSFSCEEFLNEEPQSQVDADMFYASEEAAEIGLTGVYNRFFNEAAYPTLCYLVQLSTDDIYQPSGTAFRYKLRSQMTVADAHSGLWTNLYETVANANFLIREVEPFSADIFSNPARKDEILGEAHFIKGAVYYYLYLTWGEVPVIKEFSDNLEDLIIGKSSLQEVRAYAVEELELAESMLPDVITSYSDDSETNARKGRGSKWAAKTYLARLKLEEGDYQSALNLATEITGSGLYPSANPWRTIFQEPYNSSESIFEMQNDYSPGFFGSGLYGWFMGFDFEWSADAESMFERPDVEDSTQGKDVRFELSHTPYPWGPNRRQPNKVIPSRLFEDGGIEQANIPIIRVSEARLIRAEALNELNFSGNKTEVVSILNDLRARAEDPTWENDFFKNAPEGTSGIVLLDEADFTTQEELRQAIRDEKRRELMFEDVIRWVDMLRYDKEYTKTAVDAPTDDHLYWPIPATEIARNENLVQNPAYD